MDTCHLTSPRTPQRSAESAPHVKFRVHETNAGNDVLAVKQTVGGLSAPHTCLTEL